MIELVIWSAPDRPEDSVTAFDLAETFCVDNNAEDEFQTVAAVGSIPEGEGRAFLVNGRMIAVFLRDGTYYAINDCCPHMGASLAGGYLEETNVICPWHAWKFCIKSGVWMDNPKSKVRTETFAVRVVGDQIQVGKTPLPAT